MGSPVQRRFHHDRKVRLHASGRWICTIGRVWSVRKGKLVDKDWYFSGSEADAIEKANTKARQWELLCRNWERTEAYALEILGEPVPHEPRWPAGSKTSRAQKTTAHVGSNDDRRTREVSHDEFAASLTDSTFLELIEHYGNDRAGDVNDGQIELATKAKEKSQMRQVAKFLPADLPAAALRAEHFRAAKTRMLLEFKRRTVRNYLSAGVQLLRWLYGRYAGSETRIPAGIDEAISIRGAVNLNITVHGVEELKELMKKVSGTISQLDLMLALNCGMYQEDIGRLRHDEIDLTEGSAFWDREKEPGNPFRIHHLFWPETLAIVKAYLNRGDDNEGFVDHRIRDGKPSTVHTIDLAFLDKHRPRYLIKPGGSAYDLVSRRWSALDTGVKFRNLRKSTSQLLTTLAESVKDLDERATLVEVVQQRFLGQKTQQLLRLYRTIGKGAYVQMNRYLARVGDQLRAGGVFKHLKY